jgi:hypothetical protein
MYGTSLYVIKGHPLLSLEKICNKWNVKKLVFQADRDVRSYLVENTVERLALSLNVEVYFKIEIRCMYVGLFIP